MNMSDLVNHPPHYIGAGLEAIDVIEDWGLGFHLGNAVKYILRAGKKSGDGSECFAKSAWYARRAQSLPRDALRAPASRPYTIQVATVADAFSLAGGRDGHLAHALFCIRSAAWGASNGEVVSLLDGAYAALERAGMKHAA